MAETNRNTVSEYDAFGPWVYEVDEMHPLPKLFDPFFKEGDQAITMLKVPRDIDRSNATPDMDLYDYVLALYGDKLRILERQDTQVKEHAIAAEDFSGVRFYTNLLNAACTVFYKDGALSFKFNTLSNDLVQKFFTQALETLGGKSGTEINTASLPVTESKPEAMLLLNLVHEVTMKDPDARTGAIQKSVEIPHKNGTEVNDVERMIWKKMNPEGVHLFTDKELIILEHGSFPILVGMSDYGYTYTRILFNEITGIEIAESNQYQNLMDCTIHMGQNRVTCHFGADDQEVEAFYKAADALLA